MYEIFGQVQNSKILGCIMIKKFKLLILFTTLSISLSAVSKPSFESTSKFSGRTVELKGSGVLEYLIWDVYEVSFYNSQANQGDSLIKIKYLIDLDKEKSVKGWIEGLEPVKLTDPEYAQAIKWLKENTQNVKDGDTIEYWKISPSTVYILKNKKIVAKSKKDSVFRLVHYPWIGEFPVDVNLKSKLLSN